MAEIVHQQSAACGVCGAGIVPQNIKTGPGKRLLHAFPEDGEVAGVYADADDAQGLHFGALTQIPVHRRGLSIPHGRHHRGHGAAGDGPQALLQPLGYVNGIQVPFRFRHGSTLRCASTDFLVYNGFGLYVIITILSASVNIIRIFLPFPAVKLRKERLYPACQTAEAGQDGQHRELRPGERIGVCFTPCEGDEAEAVCACCPLHSLRKAWAFSHKKSDAFQRRIFAAIGQ